jgi:hypothetical protein
MSTDDYAKGRGRGEQIQWMRAYYGDQRGRRTLYDLGVANIERLNSLFHAHSDEYWRGYSDGLLTTSSAGSPTP